MAKIKTIFLFGLISIFLIHFSVAEVKVGGGETQGVKIIPEVPTGEVSNSTSNGTTYHNLLSGLQGGTASEYYHLTNAEWLLQKYFIINDSNVNLTNLNVSGRLNVYGSTFLAKGLQLGATGSSDGTLSVNGNSILVGDVTHSLGILSSPYIDTGELFVNSVNASRWLFNQSDLTYNFNQSNLVYNFNQSDLIYNFNQSNLVYNFNQSVGLKNWNVSGTSIFPESIGYKVGIGTSTPSDILNTIGILNFTNASGTGLGLYQTASGNLRLGYPNTANRQFDIYSNDGRTNMSIYTLGTNLAGIISSTAWMALIAPGGYEMRTGGSWYWQDSDAANAVRMQLDSATGNLNLLSGRLGINSSSPPYPLYVNTNVSGISGWFLANVSADDYITRTAVFNKADESALNYIKDASAYFIHDSKGNQIINHSAFYGYVSYPKFDADTNKTIMEEGVSLGKEISMQEQAIYELKTENDLLKSELCLKDNTYSWCKI